MGLYTVIHSLKDRISHFRVKHSEIIHFIHFYAVEKRLWANFNSKVVKSVILCQYYFNHAN